MKTDKLLLPFANSNLPEYIHSKISEIFSNILIISNSKNVYIPDCQVYKDIIQSIGPIAGIHSALSNSKTYNSFIIGGDIPFFNPDAIMFLKDNLFQHDIIIFSENGRNQYLFGFYSKKIIPKIEQMVNDVKIDDKPKVKLSMRDLLENTNSKVVEITELPFYHPHFFYNINTAENYADAQLILRNLS
ncbi:MAG: molybdenum cofactor guanylyltransferase [Ignavibacteriae bacterium]|nr:molybdenum cofactor guanylyltransferase [Ignavibacteriota bacterium]